MILQPPSTIEVRAVMRRHGVHSNDIWTNRIKEYAMRHVKCYCPRDPVKKRQLLQELEKLVGAHNVHQTAGSTYIRQGAFIVRCRGRFNLLK